MKAEGKDARGILAAIKAQVAAGHLGVDLQHIPHPATWLNQSRWEDEIAPPGLSPVVPGARGQPSGTYAGMRVNTVAQGELVMRDQMAKALKAQREKEAAKNGDGLDDERGSFGADGAVPALPGGQAHA
ncbi:MAG: hypothetical protein RBR18_15070 [Desulfovibrionaceae bacterium]|nr:hypothetical protein [Desulfovibrionaceae bacterium]